MTNLRKSGVTIIIPTLNGGELFRRCLKQIRAQRFDGEVQLMVADSGSTDGTPQLAERAGAEVMHVRPENFHHARTRNLALARAAHEQVVFMVQDALPVGEDWLSALHQSIMSGSALAVYMKQLAHDDADAYSRVEMQLIAEAAGDRPRVQQISSRAEFQALPFDAAYHTIRLDNVCAIYQKTALQQYPFPDISFAEDLAWGCETVLNGGQIRYEPAIAVKHSHNRPPVYRFNREIVNSIALATIMKRVREDLSYISLAELMLSGIHFQDFVQSFRQQTLSTPRNQSPFRQDVLADIFKRHSLKTRIQMRYARLFRKNKPLPNPRLEAVLNNLKTHVHYEFSLIQNRTAKLAMDEISAVIDIIAARTLGRLYGEVYAGKMLNQCLDVEFEDFISPFRSGV